MNIRILTVVATCLVSLASWRHLAAQSGNLSRDMSETQLEVIKSGASFILSGSGVTVPLNLYVSPDFRRVLLGQGCEQPAEVCPAWNLDLTKRVDVDIKVRGKYNVIINGVRGKAYESVSGVTFSPNNERVAYVAHPTVSIWRGNPLGPGLVVLDGEEGKLYEDLLEGYDNVLKYSRILTFSPDSRKIAYGAKTENAWHVVVDAKEGPPYDGVWGLAFSPDSRRLAYAAKSQGKYTAIVNGTPGKAYDSIKWPPLFSPDSRRVVYVAKSKGKYLVVTDSQETGAYDDVPAVPVFSPDSERFAYTVKLRGKHFVLVDGHEEGPYDEVYGNTLTFTPDGQRFAYIAKSNGKAFIVIAGQRGKAYDDVVRERSVTVSPNSQHIAYVAKLGKESFTVVVDEKEGKQYSDIDARPAFSPDSRHIAYVAYKKIEDEERKYNYLILTPGEPPPLISTAAFASDLGRRFVVVDGVEGQVYPFIVRGVAFDAPDALHYIAMKGKGIYLVNETIRVQP